MTATAFITRSNMPHADAHDKLLAACQSHVRTHGAALAAAVKCIAGAPGAYLAQRLCDDIAAASRWQAGFTRRMQGLSDLLRLEHPDDPRIFAHEPTGMLVPNTAWCCWHADLIEALVARGEVLAACAVQLPRAPLRRPMRTA